MSGTTNERHLLEVPGHDVAADLFGMSQYRETVADLALLFSVVHRSSLASGTPDVNDLRQF